MSLMMRFLSLFFVIGLVLGAAHGQNALGKQRWRLAEISGKEVKTSKAYLLFDEINATFTGNGSCNAISGSIGKDSRRPKFDVTRVTMMLCARPGAMETERDLLAALAKSESFTVKKGVLTIFKGRRAVARFLSSGAKLIERETAEKLSRNDWQLESIGIVPLADKVNAPTLSFESEPGFFDGNSGCNRISGNYKVTEDSFVFGELSTTLMACIGGGSEREREFLDALARTGAFKIKPDGKLQFLSGDRVLLTFGPLKND